MKASEYIKEHGDFEITEVEKFIVNNSNTVSGLEVQYVSDVDIRESHRKVNCMKKTDFVAGKHVVQQRDRKFRFVGYNNGLFDSEGNHVRGFCFYNERLNDIDGDKAKDIVAVYELKKVWKREESTITEDERVILLNLPSNYEWIARDKNGELYLYQGKPEKSANAWENKRTCHRLGLFNHLFKMVKWEDDEPWNTEDLLNLDVKNL